MVHHVDPDANPYFHRVVAMVRRSRNPTRPGFPELLAQQTRPFTTPMAPAAFPSLPLTGKVTPVTNKASEVKDSTLQCSDDELEVQESEDPESQTSTDNPTLENPSVGELEPLWSPPLPMRVEWDSLEISGQYFIFTEMTQRLPDANSIAVTLGLTYRELEAIEHAVNMRRMHPASVDDIWYYCVAADGIGATAVSPDTLDKYMEYLVLAGNYEEVTTAGLEAIRVFLGQHGLDIVLSKAFKNRFGEYLNPLPGPSVVRNFQSGADTVLTAQSLQTDSVGQTAPRSPSDTPKGRLPVSLHHSPDVRLHSQSLGMSQSLSPSLTRVSISLDAVDQPETGLAHKRRRIEAAADTSEHKLPVCTQVTSTVQAILRDDEQSATLRSDLDMNLQSSDAEQTRSSPLSLRIDDETGRASVVGLPQRLPVRATPTRNVFQHPFHDPSAFAPHFDCASFPSKERGTLLDIDPRMMTVTALWLVYGDRALQAQLDEFMGPLTPQSTECEPRTVLLDDRGIQNHSLCSLIRLHNDWVRSGMWQSGPQEALLGHFERISVMGLETIKGLTDIDIGAQHNFEHIDPASKQSWQSLDPGVIRRTLRAEVIRRYDCGVLASRTRYEREAMAYNGAPEYKATVTNPLPEKTGPQLAPSVESPDVLLPSPKATDPSVFTRKTDQDQEGTEAGKHASDLQQIQHCPSKNSRDTSLQSRHGISLPTTDSSTQESITQETVDTAPVRVSPERPCFSPISEFGGTLPEWIIDEEMQGATATESTAVTYETLDDPTTSPLNPSSSTLTQTAQAVASSEGASTPDTAPVLTSTTISTVSTPRTQRKDAGKKRGPYKKTREKMAKEAESDGKVDADGDIGTGSGTQKRKRSARE